MNMSAHVREKRRNAAVNYEHSSRV